jgi:hypothetical protein
VPIEIDAHRVAERGVRDGPLVARSHLRLVRLGQEYLDREHVRLRRHAGVEHRAGAGQVRFRRSHRLVRRGESLARQDRTEIRLHHLEQHVRPASGGARGGEIPARPSGPNRCPGAPSVEQGLLDTDGGPEVAERRRIVEGRDVEARRREDALVEQRPEYEDGIIGALERLGVAHAGQVAGAGLPDADLGLRLGCLALLDLRARLERDPDRVGQRERRAILSGRGNRRGKQTDQDGERE